MNYMDTKHYFDTLKTGNLTLPLNPAVSHYTGPSPISKIHSDLPSLGIDCSRSSSNGIDKTRYSSGHQKAKPRDKHGEIHIHGSESVTRQQHIETLKRGHFIASQHIQLHGTVGVTPQQQMRTLNQGHFITNQQAFTIGTDCSQNGGDHARFSSNGQNAEADDKYYDLQLREAMRFTPQQQIQTLERAHLIANQHIPSSNKPKCDINSLSGCMRKEYGFVAPGCFDGPTELSTSHTMSGREFYFTKRTTYEVKRSIISQNDGANSEIGNISTATTTTDETTASLKVSKADLAIEKIKVTCGLKTNLAKDSASKAEAETNEHFEVLKHVTKDVQKENTTHDTVTDARCAQKAPEHKQMINATRSKENKWMEMFKTLQEYAEKHGNCIVPRDYDENPKLATWVGLQRKQYRLKQMGRPSYILEERISLLNNLGFTWNAKEATWNKRFEELKEYKEQFGVCTVPLSEDFFQLGRWVSFSYGMEPIVFCCAITPPHIPTLLLS